MAELPIFEDAHLIINSPIYYVLFGRSSVPIWAQAFLVLAVLKELIAKVAAYGADDKL